MWRLVRKLYDLQYSGVIENIAKEVPESAQATAMFYKLLRSFDRTKVSRTHLTWSHVITKKVLKTKVDPLADKKTQKKILKTHSLINDCIDKGFMSHDANDKEHVFLTGKGSDFRTKSYIAKYLILELGVVGSTILAVLGGIGVTKIPWSKLLEGYGS